MEAACEALDEELKTRWNEFVGNSLNPALKEQNDELGGPLGEAQVLMKMADVMFTIQVSGVRRKKD